MDNPVARRLQSNKLRRCALALSEPKSPHDRAARPLAIPLTSLHNILDQPYRHLARGGSVQVYASADGRYVLKTLATARDIIAWHASDGYALTDLPWARTLGANDAEIAGEIRAATLASFRLAEQCLRHESGLVALHFPTPDSDLPPIDCGDLIIDPGREPLVVQHRAERVDAAIARHAATHDQAAARQVIDDVVALVRHLWAMGIAEQALNFHNNYGYAQGRLILLDIGDLRRSRDMVMEHARSEKILHKKSAAWLQHRYPDLARYLAQRVRHDLSAEAIAILWQNDAH